LKPFHYILGKVTCHYNKNLNIPFRTAKHVCPSIQIYYLVTSFTTENRELIKLCNNVTSTFLEKSPPCTKEMEKTVQNFKILSPIAERNLGSGHIKIIIKGYEINTQKKCHKEKRKTKFYKQRKT
jgi:hypothetical protein